MHSAISNGLLVIRLRRDGNLKVLCNHARMRERQVYRFGGEK